MDHTRLCRVLLSAFGNSFKSERPVQFETHCAKKTENAIAFEILLTKIRTDFFLFCDQNN